MPCSTLVDETTAAELFGFISILWVVAQRALGATQRPEYDVYQEESTGRVSVYWAKVHVYQGGRAGQIVSHRYTGKPMPTPSLAIQIAAWEAIVCLRHSDPGMDCRAFRYYPNGTTAAEAVFACPLHERDVAVVHLTQYLAAQHEMILQLSESLTMSRRTLSLLHTQLFSHGTVTTFVGAPITEEQPLLGILVSEPDTSRRTSTLDFFCLFDAYAPTRSPVQRRRSTVTPWNTPVSSEHGSPRLAAISTRSPSIDVDHVD